MQDPHLQMLPGTHHGPIFTVPIQNQLTIDHPEHHHKRCLDREDCAKKQHIHKFHKTKPKKDDDKTAKNITDIPRAPAKNNHTKNTAGKHVSNAGKQNKTLLDDRKIAGNIKSPIHIYRTAAANRTIKEPETGGSIQSPETAGTSTQPECTFGGDCRDKLSYEDDYVKLANNSYYKLLEKVKHGDGDVADKVHSFFFFFIYM